MATVPAPPPAPLLSSSAHSHQNLDDPDPVHLLSPNPHPNPKNPRPTPDRPSVQVSGSDPPPPPPRSGHSTSSSSVRPPVSRASDPHPPPDPFPPLPSSSRSEPAAPPSQSLVSCPAVIFPPGSSVPPPAPESSSPPLNPPPQPPGPVPPLTTARRNPGPVPIKSYAQVAGNSRGPGFVRAHAADVEAFARLPRTGVTIVCGSKEGIPSFSFVAADLPKVEVIYANALVMKFLGGRPSLESSHREIQSWGIEHPFSIGPLSSRAFLLRFQDDKDLIRVLSRPSSTLITFPYKVFRWHNLCHRKEDSCFAPVWISLPKLPLQCFIPEFLESVANTIGRFLCLDKATATLARPSAARLCVELDLRKPPPQSIWIGLFEGLKQPVIYERLPKFCNSCLVQGHMVTECPRGQRETRPNQADPQPMTNRSCPSPVRRNVAESSSSSLQQHSPPTAPPYPVHAPTTTSGDPHPSPAPPRQEQHHHPSQNEPSLRPDAATPHRCDRALSLTIDSSTIDSVLNVVPAAMDTQPRPPPSPDVSLEDLHTPANQSTDMHVQHPSVKEHEPSPEQHQSVAFHQIHAPSFQQSNSPVVVPPPLTRSSSARPSAAFTQSISSSSINLHIQPHPSAALSPAAAVPSSSHTSSQATLLIPSAAVSVAGSAPHPVASSQQRSRSSPKAVQGLLAMADASGHPSQFGVPLASSWAPPPPLPQQFNMEANQAFWNAVNYQLALNAQAHHKVPTSDASFRPSVTRSLEINNPSALTVAAQPSPLGDDSSSKSSAATDSQPNSPSSPTLGAHFPYASVQKSSYVSEGEELMSEPTYFQGHNTDDMLWQRPRTSKRNKRHPDQPLKVQLRARKGRNLRPA